VGHGFKQNLTGKALHFFEGLLHLTPIGDGLVEPLILFPREGHADGFAPHLAGTAEDAIVQMPDPGVTYFFAIRAQDEAGNLGPLSNVATAKSFQLDSDGDGMPDRWESTYLGGTGASPAAVVDGDGLSNFQEYIAGTHPGSASSKPEVLGLTPAPGEAYGFYGDSGVIVEHDVIDLMHRFIQLIAAVTTHRTKYIPG
jgi:hypothetical protein